MLSELPDRPFHNFRASRAENFMQHRNVVRRIFKLKYCERFGRVWTKWSMPPQKKLGENNVITIHAKSKISIFSWQERKSMVYRKPAEYTNTLFMGASATWIKKY